MNATITRTKTTIILTVDHVELHFDRVNALRLAAQIAAAAREVEDGAAPVGRVSGFAGAK